MWVSMSSYTWAVYMCLVNFVIDRRSWVSVIVGWLVMSSERETFCEHDKRMWQKIECMWNCEEQILFNHFSLHNFLWYFFTTMHTEALDVSIYVYLFISTFYSSAKMTCSSTKTRSLAIAKRLRLLHNIEIRVLH